MTGSEVTVGKMLENTISGYRHKVAFFKTPGDLWMLKGTSPNVCLTIAPNYRLQNEIPTIDSSGNVITRRFVGPLLRRYCNRIKTLSPAKPTPRRLICEGRAIGCAPNDLADGVIRKADTSNADDVRQADDVRKAGLIYDTTGADDYRKPDDIQRQSFSTGYRRVRYDSEGWPKTRPGLPWNVGRVYTGDSLLSVTDRSRLSTVKEGTRFSLTVSLSRNKQVIASGRIVQQPKYNSPVLYGNINGRAFAIGEKKHFSQVQNETKIINNFMEEGTGSNSELRTHSKPNIQNSLVVCKLHPLKTRSGPTVAKSSDLIIRRAANNSPETSVGTLKAYRECQAPGESEQISGITDPSTASHERCRRVTAQSASEPDATFLQKDHFMGKNMIFAGHQAKDP